MNKKSLESTIYLLDFYLPTTDDWYPNYVRNTVRVRVTRLPRHNQTIRVSVWGADDDGMERDETLPEDRKLCEKRVKEITAFAKSMPNPLTKSWLKANGFVRA